MKDKLIVVVVVAGLLAGCGRSAARRSNQHEYEVVQEGSASGVTSTIHGPGETVPPITATNVDTTTAFTLDPNATATATTQQPEWIAGTLPPAVPATQHPPMTSAPAPPPARPVTPRPQPPPAQPEPEPEPAPAQTAPAPVPVEPPPAPTDTAPQPPTQTETAPPPAQTETEEPPPPPPPPPL